MVLRRSSVEIVKLGVPATNDLADPRREKPRTMKDLTSDSKGFSRDFDPIQSDPGVATDLVRVMKLPSVHQVQPPLGSGFVWRRQIQHKTSLDKRGVTNELQRNPIAHSAPCVRIAQLCHFARVHDRCFTSLQAFRSMVCDEKYLKPNLT